MHAHELIFSLVLGGEVFHLLLTPLLLGISLCLGTLLSLPLQLEDQHSSWFQYIPKNCACTELASESGMKAYTEQHRKPQQSMFSMIVLQNSPSISMCSTSM